MDHESTNQRLQESANSGMEAGVRADIRQAGEGGSVGEDEKSCMNCDKFECTEVGPCVRWAYAPGTDEIESKENAMSDWYTYEVDNA